MRAAVGALTAAMENPIAVDTQTTNKGGSQTMSLFGPPQMQGGEPEAVAAEPAESQRDTVPWVPPLHADLGAAASQTTKMGGHRVNQRPRNNGAPPMRNSWQPWKSLRSNN